MFLPGGSAYLPKYFSDDDKWCRRNRLNNLDAARDRRDKASKGAKKTTSAQRGVAAFKRAKQRREDRARPAKVMRFFIKWIQLASAVLVAIAVAVIGAVHSDEDGSGSGSAFGTGSGSAQASSDKLYAWECTHCAPASPSSADDC